jgi:hypothetical protein
MLTGLTAAQLRTFGDFRVVMSVTGTELVPAAPLAPVSAG